MTKPQESESRLSPTVNHRDPGDKSSSPNSGQTEVLFGQYVERTMSGEVLDLDRVARDHPDCGHLLVQLTTIFNLQIQSRFILSLPLVTLQKRAPQKFVTVTISLCGGHVLSRTYHS